MDAPRTLATNSFMPYAGKFWPVLTDAGPYLVNRRGEALTGDAAIAEVTAETLTTQPHMLKRDIAQHVEQMLREADTKVDLYDRIGIADGAVHLYLGNGRNLYSETPGSSDIEDWADYVDDYNGRWKSLNHLQYPTVYLPAPELPEPDMAGTRDELREILGFAPDDPAWLQVYGWLIGSLFGDIDRPILWLVGPQGSGKSTLGRLLVSIFHPIKALGGPFRDPRSDMARFIAQRCPTFDNVTDVSQAQSDQLCRLVTGETYERRALFTDDALLTDVIRRTAVATSIVLPHGLRADALQRCLVVELDTVLPKNRKLQGKMDAAFKDAHARILGAVLNDILGVLQNEPYEDEETGETTMPAELPRLADFGLILHQLGLHTGLDFLGAYNSAVGDTLADRAKESGLARRLAEHITGTWQGTTADLVALIGFRGSPESLGGQVRKETETLRAVGIRVDSKRTMAGRLLTIDVA